MFKVVRHRIKRRTLGKDPIKKSVTKVDTIGNGSNVNGFTLMSSASTRSADGSLTTVRDSQTTGLSANIGDILKYVNICIEAASRNEMEQGEENDNGWLEWGVVYQQETSGFPGATNLGVQTLGDILVKTFRGNCLLTGCIPVGKAQPITQDIKIKIPQKYCKVQQSSILQLFYYFRSVNSTDLRTDSTKVVLSAIYKLYV